jgi:hypothetical protein
MSSFIKALDPSNPFRWVELACKQFGQPNMAAEMKKHGDLQEAAQLIAACKAANFKVPTHLAKLFDQRFKKAFGSNYGPLIRNIVEELERSHD